MPIVTYKTSLPCCASYESGVVRWIACAVLTVAIALCPAGARATGACSSDDDQDPEAAPLFAPGIESPGDQDLRQGPGEMPNGELEEVNRKEWGAYFRGKAQDKNLAFLIYKMKLEDLDKLIWTLEGKRRPAPVLSPETAAVKADLDAVGDKAKVLRALYYLGFAKRCEPIATRLWEVDPWDQPKVSEARERDAVTADKLLAASAGLLTATKDTFLQERYHFQRLRLLFYTRRHSEAQQYYSAHFAAFTTESSVKYRFMHTAAGSFYREGKHGPANYLFAVVYDRFEALRESSYLSFRPMENPAWKESLALAKADRERIAIWRLVGLKYDQEAALTNIYGISPSSSMLPNFLVGTVNHIVENYARVVDEQRGPSWAMPGSFRPYEFVVDKKILGLLRRIADDKNAPLPYLWQLALGHVYAMAGDWKAALAHLERAEKLMPKTEPLLRQLHQSRLLARVRAIQVIDKAQEPALAVEMRGMKERGYLTDPEARWMMHCLADVYGKGGDSVRAAVLARMLPKKGNQELYPDNRKLDPILVFLATTDKSAFDQYLANEYPYKPAQLTAMMARNDLYAGRFQSSADLLSRAEQLAQATKKQRELAGHSEWLETYDFPLFADPFVTHIRDRVPDDPKAKPTHNYTPITFIRKLNELSREAQRAGEKGAQASFLLANGLYNISCYGNVAEHFGAGNSWHSRYQPGPGCRMDEAEKYYKRAMDLSRDKEFQAKACFRAAKTEQNRYFTAYRYGELSSTANPEVDVHSPVYFKKLKDSFSKTRYYQEIIKECGYFRSYLGRK